MALKDKVKEFLKNIVKTIGEKLALELIKKSLTTDNIINVLDGGLDFLEDLAAKTDTKIDDEILKKIRDGLNIPDND